MYTTSYTPMSNYYYYVYKQSFKDLFCDVTTFVPYLTFISPPVQRISVGKHLQIKVGLGGIYVDSTLTKIKSVVGAQTKL